MPDVTVSTDVDSMLQAGTNEAIRTAIGSAAKVTPTITGPATFSGGTTSSTANIELTDPQTTANQHLSKCKMLLETANEDQGTFELNSGNVKIGAGTSGGGGIGTFLSADVNAGPDYSVSLNAGNGALFLAGDVGVKVRDDLHVATGGAGTQTAKVGIRTETPSSALDVNGTIKGTDLNINAKGFFVGNGANGDYLQAKDYGHGDFHTVTGNTNQPKSTTGFGSAGKLLEKTLIKTIKLQGTGFTGLATPAVIVSGIADKYIVPVEMSVFCDFGTRVGVWGVTGGNSAIQIGTFQNQNNTGGFAQFLAVPVSTALTASDWLTRKSAPTQAELKQFANRDLVLKSVHVPSSEANAPDGTWYIQLEYMILDEYESFKNNFDATIGTAF